MIGRDAEADQAVGHRHPVDHVDPDIVAIMLLERLGAVIAGGSRPDHRNMPHPASAVRLPPFSAAPRGGIGPLSLRTVLEQLGRGRRRPASIALPKKASAGGSSTLTRTRLSWTSIAASSSWPDHARCRASRRSPCQAERTCAPAGRWPDEAADIGGDPPLRLLGAEAVGQVDADRCIAHAIRLSSRRSRLPSPNGPRVRRRRSLQLRGVALPQIGERLVGPLAHVERALVADLAGPKIELETIG